MREFVLKIDTFFVVMSHFILFSSSTIIHACACVCVCVCVCVCIDNREIWIGNSVIYGFYPPFDFRLHPHNETLLWLPFLAQIIITWLFISV